MEPILDLPPHDSPPSVHEVSVSAEPELLLVRAPEREAELRMRNDYPKAVHAALLSRLGTCATREFWAGCPLAYADRSLSERELAEHVWNERETSPVRWALPLAQALESFLARYGISYEEFIEDVHRFANRGSFVQLRYLLPWLAPILLPLFRFGDAYRLILYGAPLVAKRISPGVDFRMLPWHGAASAAASRCSGSLWVTYPGLAEGRIPAWDFIRHTGLEIRVAPRIFGLAPFESLVAVCDARRAEAVLGRASSATLGDRFVIDGVTRGRLLPFGEFLDAAGYRAPKLGPLGTPVVVPDRDEYCARRARVVLHAGCAYGAPGYLLRVGWRARRAELKSFLKFANAEAGAPSEADQALERLQALYVASLSETLRVVYHASDGSIEAGGRHVCRGVPARILYECLLILGREGRNVFSFREFKRLPSLISHPKNTGFETRLNRLRTALASADCGITLDAIPRGQFRVNVRARIDLITA